MADLQPDSAYAKERFADASKTLEFDSEQEKKFQYILSRYPTRQAALLPTLHHSQEIWGWCSPEVMLYVARRLELEPAYVFGVVSFYNMYNQRPVGKYHIQVCTNLSCMVRDAYDIYEHCLGKLHIAPGQTTKDDRYTVVEVECLGSCGTAPVVQVNNDYHEDMTVEKMEQLFTKLT
jgi:NADH-quinone oxidoreductase E subunit